METEKSEEQLGLSANQAEIDALLKDEPTSPLAKETKKDDDPAAGGGGSETVIPDDILGKIANGKFKTVDELNQVLTGLDGLTETQTQLKDISAKYDDLQKQHTALSEKVPYEDPELYRLHVVKKKNPENYDMVKNLVFGKIPPLEVLKMAYVQENPEFKDRPEDVDAIISDQYKDLQNPDLTDEQKRIINLRIEADAVKARKTLLSEFNSVQVPTIESLKLSQQEEDAKVNALLVSWQGAFGAVKKEFDKLPVIAKDKDGKEKYIMDLEIPESERRTYYEQAIKTIAMQRIPPNEKNGNAVLNFMRNLYLQDNFPRIVNTIVTRAMAINDEQWRNWTHNSTKLQNSDRQAAIEKNAQQKETDKLLEEARTV